MKTVKEIMSNPVASVKIDASVQEAAKLMAKKNIGSVAVLMNKKLIGILTERDVSEKIVARNKTASIVEAQEIMHSPVITAAPDTTIYEASSIMEKGNFRRLPIVNGEKLVGIVTQTDVEMALREESIDELRTKVHELQIFNDMAIGRELKMAELKKKIHELKGEK